MARIPVTQAEHAQLDAELVHPEASKLFEGELKRRKRAPKPEAAKAPSWLRPSDGERLRINAASFELVKPTPLETIAALLADPDFKFESYLMSDGTAIRIERVASAALLRAAVYAYRRSLVEPERLAKLAELKAVRAKLSADIERAEKHVPPEMRRE